MTAQLVTLTNDFHNSSVQLRCEVLLSHIYHEATIYPTESQIRRAKKTLCGINGCTCSDAAGTRGPQEHNGKRLIVNLNDLSASLFRSMIENSNDQLLLNFADPSSA